MVWSLGEEEDSHDRGIEGNAVRLALIMFALKCSSLGNKFGAGEDLGITAWEQK